MTSFSKVRELLDLNQPNLNPNITPTVSLHAPGPLKHTFKMTQRKLFCNACLEVLRHINEQLQLVLATANKCIARMTSCEFGV